MRERSTHPDTFVIERSFPASPARVLHAWADPAAKAVELRAAGSGTG
jgi:uncharacterized protein YndB with AHSA1/START domain